MEPNDPIKTRLNTYRQSIEQRGLPGEIRYENLARLELEKALSSQGTFQYQYPLLAKWLKVVHTGFSQTTLHPVRVALLCSGFSNLVLWLAVPGWLNLALIWWGGGI